MQNCILFSLYFSWTTFAMKNPGLQICFPYKAEPKQNWLAQKIHPYSVCKKRKSSMHGSFSGASKKALSCKTSYVGRWAKTSSAFGLSPFFRRQRKRRSPRSTVVVATLFPSCISLRFSTSSSFVCIIEACLPTVTGALPGSRLQILVSRPN